MSKTCLVSITHLYSMAAKALNSLLCIVWIYKIHIICCTACLVYCFNRLIFFRRSSYLDTSSLVRRAVAPLYIVSCLVAPTGVGGGTAHLSGITGKLFRLFICMVSLSKDSIFILFQFMNFYDHYLLLSCVLIAFLYPQIHFDWWLKLIGIK